MTNILKSTAYYLLLIVHFVMSLGSITTGSKADQIRTIGLAKAIIIDIVALIILISLVFVVAISVS